MKIENCEVYGFSVALRGMRNPMNSWDKSDSQFCICGQPAKQGNTLTPESPKIGPNDLILAKKLIKGGSEHRKFLRHIQIWADLTLPIYIWSELDTYKVSTVRNSCSTMHKLGSIDLTQEDFAQELPSDYLTLLNLHGKFLREAVAEKNSTKANNIRQAYKGMLPSGYLQKATYMMSYETALNMYFQRQHHRLPEWNVDNPKSICSWIKSLPYMDEFIKAKE